MLLDEEPATLIHHTIGNFNIQPDKHAVSRIHDSLDTLHQARAMRRRETEADLKRLARAFEARKKQYDDAVESHRNNAPSTRMMEMDDQKFRVAKAASDLEIENERLESELEGLSNRLQALDVQGLDGDDASRARRESEDPVVLKLKIYRSLGIEVEPDAAGNYNKAVIRNDKKSDVHVVNIDPKFSRYFYANYFWSTL